MNDLTLLMLLVGACVGFIIGHASGSLGAIRYAARLHADIWKFVADAVGSVGGSDAQVELMRRLNERLESMRKEEAKT